MRDLKTSIFRGLTILLLLIAAVLFLLSMADTVFVTTQQPIKGYWVLLTGWMGFVIFQFAWFANPLTLLSLLLFRRRTGWALVSSSLALICLSQAFMFDNIPVDTTGKSIEILARGGGFYYWVGMVACVFYACIMMMVYRALKKDLIKSPPEIPSSILVADQNLHGSMPQVTSLSFPDGAISTRSNP
jgi:hypothetical protein